MSVYVGVHTQTPSASSSFPESSIHGTSALTSLSSRSWKVGLSLEGTYKSSIRDFQEYTFSYSMDGFLLLHGSGCRVSSSSARCLDTDKEFRFACMPVFAELRNDAPSRSSRSSSSGRGSSNSTGSRSTSTSKSRSRREFELELELLELGWRWRRCRSYYSSQLRSPGRGAGGCAGIGQ